MDNEDFDLRARTKHGTLIFGVEDQISIGKEDQDATHGETPSIDGERGALHT